MRSLMLNQQVADIFRNIGHILEIKGDNAFKIRAYLRAADTLEGISEDLEDIEREGRLCDLSGIGKDLAAKIAEFIGFDKIKYYEELKKTISFGLLDLLSIPGIGPKTAKLLYERLKISDIVTLEKYAKAGKLNSLPGMKEKTAENILRGIELVKKGRERMDLGTAFGASEEFIAELKKNPSVLKIGSAGSLRRMKDIIRDIDILVASNKPTKVIDSFVKIKNIQNILSKGETKSSIVTREGLQVDLRVVDQDSFGAAMLYFTGSKAHNIKLRQLAIKKGLRINEYGVYKSARPENPVAAETEVEIYKLLGLPYIEPELREDNGEIEAAKKNKLPKIVTEADIKGDLHVHSTYSDGYSSIKDMALIAQKKGYGYIALCDHSVSLKVAGGLDGKALAKKRKEIDKLNKELKIKIFFGTEVELDKDGRCDYSDKILSGFDIVIGAIHSGFRQSKEKVTGRLITACQNKHVDIIAHPTGRLWGVRDAYEIDFSSFFKAAVDTGTFLEISSFPTRLDLSDLNCRRAKEAGVKFVISTDAHHIAQLDYMRFGVSVARRGWLTKNDIVNTLSLNEFLKKKK